MNIHQKMVIFFFFFFFEVYFKAIILSLKIYENILKFNFLMRGWGGGGRMWGWLGRIRLIDYFHCFMKNNEVSQFHNHAKKT